MYDDLLSNTPLLNIPRLFIVPFLGVNWPTIFLQLSSIVSCYHTCLPSWSEIKSMENYLIISCPLCLILKKSTWKWSNFQKKLIFFTTPLKRNNCVKRRIYNTPKKEQLCQKKEQLTNSAHDTLRMNLKHYILFWCEAQHSNFNKIGGPDVILDNSGACKLSFEPLSHWRSLYVHPKTPSPMCWFQFFSSE